MKKAILISIKPEWVEKILNGLKTIEIRKSMPKCDLPIDVYIYCSKGDVNLYKVIRKTYVYFSGAVAEPFDEQIAFGLTKEKLDKKHRDNIEDGFSDIFTNLLNGKVVAKFTLNKVDRMFRYGNVDGNYQQIFKQSCLSNGELAKYLKKNNYKSFAWHIENLQIFDKPMELNQFDKYYDEPDDLKPCCNGKHCIHESYDWCENQSCCDIDYDGTDCLYLKVNKPPRSWQYVYIGD